MHTISMLRLAAITVLLPFLAACGTMSQTSQKDPKFTAQPTQFKGIYVANPMIPTGTQYQAGTGSQYAVTGALFMHDFEKLGARLKQQAPTVFAQYGLTAEFDNLPRDDRSDRSLLGAAEWSSRVMPQDAFLIIEATGSNTSVRSGMHQAITGFRVRILDQQTNKYVWEFKFHVATASGGLFGQSNGYDEANVKDMLKSICDRMLADQVIPSQKTQPR